MKKIFCMALSAALLAGSVPAYAAEESLFTKTPHTFTARVGTTEFTNDGTAQPLDCLLYTSPGGSGRWPGSSVSVSCGKGSRPACALWAAVVYIGSLSCVPSIFPLPFSPKRLPAPFLRRVPALARSPDFGTFCPEVARCGASPAGVFLFGWSFIFQGAVHR